MAQLQIVLSPGDLTAAIQNWVALPANGSHQMNATVAPVVQGNGTVLVLLNT